MLKNWWLNHKLRLKKLLLGLVLGLGGLVITAIIAALWVQKSGLVKKNESMIQSSRLKEQGFRQKLQTVEDELAALQSADQYKINQDLQAKIKATEETYRQAVKNYENLLDLGNVVKDTSEYEEQFAESLTLLSQLNYTSASAVLAAMNTKMADARQQATVAFQIPAEVAVNNTPPSSGYQRQQVNTSAGTFMVSIVSADLNTCRVAVDTASEKDCFNDCPVLSLADYVSRNGAFAGINGSYFCPASYPSCAGKTNTFDTLLMNKNKVYFNSDNNVYSTVPAVIFSGNSARFVGQSLEWGRDTGVDAVIANQPLLVSGGGVVFGGDGDVKHGSKGGRSFIGATGSSVYIGVVHNATVAEAAVTIQTMGIQYALNLDDGGSTALWSGGYVVGPGRNIPNAVVLVRK